MSQTETSNPHWIGNLPSWDISLPNGEILKDVTRKVISPVLQRMAREGLIHLYDSYITDCVREHHIQNFSKGHMLFKENQQ
jgi:hypothetical protein